MSDHSKDQELNTTDDLSFFGIITEYILNSKIKKLGKVPSFISLKTLTKEILYVGL